MFGWWALAVLGMSAAISLTVWVTKSPWPLLAFMLLPGFKSKRDKGT